MSKCCWIDVETSGLDPKSCAIIQLAILVEIDGVVEKEISINMKPDESDIIDEMALKIHGTTKEMVETYIAQGKGYQKMMYCLNSYVDKYNKQDKFVFCAYNAHFDEQFVREFFRRNGSLYYGSYFFWPTLDVQSFLAREIMKGLRLPDYKLATVCEHFGVKIDAHEALSDIKATRKLYRIFTEGDDR